MILALRSTPRPAMACGRVGPGCGTAARRKAPTALVERALQVRAWCDWLTPPRLLKFVSIGATVDADSLPDCRALRHSTWRRKVKTASASFGRRLVRHPKGRSRVSTTAFQTQTGSAEAHCAELVKQGLERSRAAQAAVRRVIVAIAEVAAGDPGGKGCARRVQRAGTSHAGPGPRARWRPRPREVAQCWHGWGP